MITTLALVVKTLAAQVAAGLFNKDLVIALEQLSNNLCIAGQLEMGRKLLLLSMQLSDAAIEGSDAYVEWTTGVNRTRCIADVRQTLQEVQELLA